MNQNSTSLAGANYNHLTKKNSTINICFRYLADEDERSDSDDDQDDDKNQEDETNKGGDNDFVERQLVSITDKSRSLCMLKQRQRQMRPIHSFMMEKTSLIFITNGFSKNHSNIRTNNRNMVVYTEYELSSYPSVH